MQSILLAVACCAVLGGCAPATFPTEAQSDAAYKAVHEDKAEHIVPAALAGAWKGNKGSDLTFGPGHAAVAHFYGESETTKGQYKLEGTKLFLNDKAVGWIELEKPNVLRYATSTRNVERFSLVKKA